MHIFKKKWVVRRWVVRSDFLHLTNIEFSRKLGCLSYIYIEKQFPTKLEKTVEVVVFLGFGSVIYANVHCRKTDG